MIGKKKNEQLDDGLRLEDIDQRMLDEIVAERDKLRDENERILRAAADAQNRLRTARKDVQESHRQGVTAVARDVIAGLDSFDLALSQDMSTATVDSIVEGVRSIRDELIRVLNRHGVTLIEAAPGEELDPQRHQAMMEQPTDQFEPGHIVAMVQVGYMLHDRVIRPAKVIVAASPPGAQAEATETSPDDATDPAEDADGAEEDARTQHQSHDGDPAGRTPDAEGVYHIDDTPDDLSVESDTDENDDTPGRAPRED